MNQLILLSRLMVKVISLSIPWTRVFLLQSMPIRPIVIRFGH